LSIDHHLVDIINLVGIILGILGFLYITYEFFGRKPLKWVIRVITPSLVGIVILAPSGIGVYLYFFGFTGLVFRGALTYGLVGVLIGAFNGIFVDWPSSSQKPLIFSRRGYLAGFLLSFFGWFVVSLSIWSNLIAAFVEAGIVAVAGGFAGALWRFLNWESFLFSNQAYSFSWQGCCIGAILAFLFGFTATLILGYPVTMGILEGSILVPTGGILGSFWHIFKKQQPSSVSTLQPPLAPDSLAVETHGNTEQDNSIEVVPLIGKAPLFSWKGCLIGLIVAFLFGFVWAAVGNIVVNTFFLGISFTAELPGSLKGAITTAAFTSPGGAITGGISRFIFWRADSLKDNQLGGIGAIITLIGFFLQLLPPLVSLLNIPM
jgi:hypothetical protein